MATHTRNGWPAVAAAGLVGLLAVAAALAAGHLVAGLVDRDASPFVAVGNTAVDLSPAWLTRFAISTFGGNDKAALLIGMAVVIAAIGVAAGIASRRSPRPGLIILVVLGVLGLLAVLTRPTASAPDLLAPVAALLAGTGTFAFLHRLGTPPAPMDAAAGEPADPAEPAGGRLVARRTLLQGSGAVAVAAGIAGYGGNWLATRAEVEQSRLAIRDITPTEPAPPIPRGADFAAEGTPTFLTPNSDFYRIDTAIVLPRLPAEDWELRIHGMVDRETTIDFADLVSRRSVERTVTMTCVSNEVGGPYISTANFTGVPLADLLADVGVHPEADQLFTTSVDGWTCGTPAAAVLDRDVEAMLVYGMNREALPIEHGFPVRMLVPGLYGYVSGTKWIVDMEFTRFADRNAYWLDRGWARRAPIKTMSRIDRPALGGTARRDDPITGIAWAQTTGIDRVEVRIDNGEWQTAELSTEVNANTWRMWRLRTPLSPGSHTAEVRATDRSGYTQTPRRALPAPDGATGWHSISFTVQ